VLWELGGRGLILFEEVRKGHTLGVIFILGLER
jgi:hypothetical protein